MWEQPVDAYPTVTLKTFVGPDKQKTTKKQLKGIINKLFFLERNKAK